YRIDGWNLAHLAIVNFALFGALLAAVALAIRRADPALGAPWIALFLVLLLSGTSRQNHAWAFQSQFHFFLLFLLLPAVLLFDARQRSRDQALGLLCLAGSAYSFSGGVACAGVLLVGYAAFKLPRARSAREKRRQLLGVTLAGAAAIALWFV